MPGSQSTTNDPLTQRMFYSTRASSEAASSTARAQTPAALNESLHAVPTIPTAKKDLLVDSTGAAVNPVSVRVPRSGKPGPDPPDLHSPRDSCQQAVAATHSQFTKDQRRHEEAIVAIFRAMVQEELGSQAALLRTYTHHAIRAALEAYVQQAAFQEIQVEVARLRARVRESPREVDSALNSPRQAQRVFPGKHEHPQEDDGDEALEGDYAPYSAPLRRSDGLGPHHSRLCELIPSDMRFQRLVSYRRYRLRNRDQVFGPAVSRNIGIWTRRLQQVMDKHALSGTRPVSCLRLLSAFKKALDDEDIPEGAVLRIWPNFLTHDAYELFNQLTEDGDAQIGDFASYPEAVQFIFRTYANDRTIEDAVERLETLQQSATETPKQFYR